MLVLMKSMMAGPSVLASPGQIVEVDNDTAIDLLNGGFAVPVEPVIESTSIVPPETGDLPKNRSRRGKK